MNREEVTVQIGVDASTMKLGVTSAKQQLGGLDDFAQGWAKHMGSKLHRTLYGILGVDLIGLLKTKFEELADYTSKTFFNAWFGVGLDVELGKQLDKFRKKFREMNKERWADEKALDDLTLSENQKKLTTQDKIEDSQTRIQELTEDISDAEEAIAAHQKIGENRVKLAKARLDLKKEELNLETLITKQNEQQAKLSEAKAKEIALRNRAAEKQRETIIPVLQNPANMALVNQIAALDVDAAASERGGNRSRAAVDRRISADLTRQLQQRINAQMSPKMSPQDAAVKNVLDKIAPLIQEPAGIPVVVKNTD